MPRPRKPAEQHLLQGTFRADRHGKTVPKPRVNGTLRPPKWLPEGAKAAWKRVAPELTRLGLLTRIDLAAFTAYCVLFYQWQKVAERVNNEGVTYKSGELTKRNPLVPVMQGLARDLLAIATAFGMTPASRQRIHVEPLVDEEDPLENYIKGLNGGQL